MLTVESTGVSGAEELKAQRLDFETGRWIDFRTADRTTLEGEVTAWLQRRNTNHAKADWRFTSADARIKLKSLYPSP